MSLLGDIGNGFKTLVEVVVPAPVRRVADYVGREVENLADGAREVAGTIAEKATDVLGPVSGPGTPAALLGTISSAALPALPFVGPITYLGGILGDTIGGRPPRRRGKDCYPAPLSDFGNRNGISAHGYGYNRPQDDLMSDINQEKLRTHQQIQMMQQPRLDLNHHSNQQRLQAAQQMQQVQRQKAQMRQRAQQLREQQRAQQMQRLIQIQQMRQIQRMQQIARIQQMMQMVQLMQMMSQMQMGLNAMGNQFGLSGFGMPGMGQGGMGFGVSAVGFAGYGAGFAPMQHGMFGC